MANIELKNLRPTKISVVVTINPETNEQRTIRLNPFQVLTIDDTAMAYSPDLYLKIAGKILEVISGTPPTPQQDAPLTPVENRELNVVPPGGSTSQVLAKASGTDYDTHWVNGSGGGADPTKVLKVGDTMTGDLAMGATGIGLILMSPSGYRFRVGVDDDGIVTSEGPL